MENLPGEGGEARFNQGTRFYKYLNVRDTLIKYEQFSEKEIEVIIQLCTRNEALPQGAPTSPHLANLALWNFEQLI